MLISSDYWVMVLNILNYIYLNQGFLFVWTEPNMDDTSQHSFRCSSISVNTTNKFVTWINGVTLQF